MYKPVSGSGGEASVGSIGKEDGCMSVFDEEDEGRHADSLT